MNEPQDATDSSDVLPETDEPRERSRGMTRSSLERLSKRSKITELGVFTSGIGIILACLTLYLTFILPPVPGHRVSFVALAVPLTISAIYVLLGLLSLLVKRRMIIQLTMGLVALGFIYDLLIGFSIVKACISISVIGLIIKTGKEALEELNDPLYGGNGSNQLGGDSDIMF